VSALDQTTAAVRRGSAVWVLLCAIGEVLEDRLHQPPAAFTVQCAVDRVLGGASPATVAQDLFDSLEQLDSYCIWPESLPSTRHLDGSGTDG